MNKFTKTLIVLSIFALGLAAFLIAPRTAEVSDKEFVEAVIKLNENMKKDYANSEKGLCESYLNKMRGLRPAGEFTKDEIQARAKQIARECKVPVGDKFVVVETMEFVPVVIMVGNRDVLQGKQSYYPEEWEIVKSYFE